MMEREKKPDREDFRKQLVKACMLVFSFCFMLFIYEPLLMYSTNKNDFWFDFRIMIVPTLVLFVLFFLAGTAFMTALGFLFWRLPGGRRGCQIYQCILVAFFVVFLATYIQGNFMTSSLPVLTGEDIKWDTFLKQDLITIGVWIFLEISAICLVIKYKGERVVRWCLRISAAIFLMLLAGLLTQMIANDAFRDKDAMIVTNDHMNDISSGKNFLIFLVDAVDSDVFLQLIDGKQEYREVFADFTYYTDTMSFYPYTRDSIPLILSGGINKNEKAFEEYASEAYDNSKLFARLEQENYDIGIYTDSLVWYGDHQFRVVNDMKNNASSIYGNMDLYMYFRQEMKYILFKYLPYAYKQYSQIEGLDFGRALEQYSYYDDIVYDEIVGNPELPKKDSNVFQFIHIEGAHLPFEFDKDLNEIEKGTYTQKMEASIKVIDAWLTRLRNNDAYDNSVILIMADHGYLDVDHENSGEEILSRFHPILLIKGLGEEHELEESHIPVSHLDLMDAYMGLLDGKKGGEVFDNIDPDRERTVIWYEYRDENHMVEYRSKGKAGEREAFEPTGNVYDR